MIISVYIYICSITCIFFSGILLSHHSLFQNPRFLSSSKAQVLHELPSAEDFFKTYVLTGTPVEPWLHITLVMTRNTQLIKTNIGNLVMLYFVGIYEKTLIKVDHCCEAQSFILTLKKRPSVLRDGCFSASAWDFVLLVFFFPSTESGDEGDSWCLSCWTFSACRDITRLCVFEKKM